VREFVSDQRIVVASGKGGTGKTTFATSLAVVLADRGIPTGYVDCDVEEPNGHLFLNPALHQSSEVTRVVPEIDPQRCTRCGACATACRAGALLVTANGVAVFADLCNGCGGCVLACEEQAIQEIACPVGTVRTGTVERPSAAALTFVGGETLVGATATPEVIRATIAAAPADRVLVLDAPPGTTCPAVEAMRSADVALLVAEPTPFGLNDLRLTVDVARSLGLPFAVAINRSGIGDDALSDYCDAEGIPVLLEVANDRRIAEACSRGALVADSFPELRDRFVTLSGDLRHLARQGRRPGGASFGNQLPDSEPGGEPEPSASIGQGEPGYGRELVVISGKGGTGKTSITASFLALASQEVNAVDCDADAANLHLVLDPQVRDQWRFSGGAVAVVDPETCVDCGICEDACRFDAIGPDEASGRGYVASPLACEGCGVCVDVCPARAVELVTVLEGDWFVSDTRHGPLTHARLVPGRKNSGKLVSRIREAARGVASQAASPLTIADGSPGIGCAVIASLTGSQAALIVTEPTLSGLHDLRRVASLARQLNVPAGVCVNKADLNPELATRIEVEATGLGLPALGRVRYDETVTLAQLTHTSVVELGDGPATRDIRRLWQRVNQLMDSSSKSGGKMTIRIAVPVAGATLCSHFGQCEAFALFTSDPDTATIISREDATPPQHAPGVYPQWLAAQGVAVVIAGGMGATARDLFVANDIQVVLGAQPGDPAETVQAYLTGQLASGENACGHGEQSHSCGH
jgi:MinD superfamily P-loop ATPase/predicted Fe-Mo cluster-binding NifX family protein